MKDKLFTVIPASVEKMLEEFPSEKIQDHYRKVLSELINRSDKSDLEDDWFQFSTKQRGFQKPRWKGERHTLSKVIRWFIDKGILEVQTHLANERNMEYYTKQGKECPDYVEYYHPGSDSRKLKFKKKFIDDMFSVKLLELTKADEERIRRQHILTQETVREYSIKCLVGFSYDMKMLEEIVNNLKPGQITLKGLNRGLNSIQEFDFDSYSGTEGKQVSRVYNNLTRIPRILRPCLTWDTEKICEIDFACFQPIICVSLNDESFRKKFSWILNEYVKVDDIEWNEVTEEDVAMLFDKDLYSILANDQKLTRRQIKYGEPPKITGMVNYMFGKDETKRNKFFLAIQNWLPVLHRTCKALKQKETSRLSGEAGEEFHRAAARILQNIEAEIIFGIIGRRLYEKEIQFSTIHDAIIVKESDLEKTAKEVKQALRNEGILPFGRELKVKTKVIK